MKLFNLGLPKSGTTTVQTAFERAGLKSAHWYVKGMRRHVGRSMYRNYFAGADPLLHFADFDVITQADFVNRQSSFWPQMDLGILRAVQMHHPDVRFFMITRNTEKLVSSLLRWDDLIERMSITGAPGLPAQFAASPPALHRWIEGHYDTTRRLFGSDPGFVELDIDDPEIQDKLSVLVGVPLPWWGNVNANTKRPEVSGASDPSLAPNA